jgi:hypothetical protein
MNTRTGGDRQQIHKKDKHLRSWPGSPNFEASSEASAYLLALRGKDYVVFG